MRLVVFNLNSAACENGLVGVDSDSDGVCDEDEIAYSKKSSYRTAMGNRRFDPTGRNSFDPNYNDSFFWKFSVLPTGTGLGECRSACGKDDDLDFLNKCEEAMIHDTGANGPHADWRIFGGVASDENPIRMEMHLRIGLSFLGFDWIRPILLR